MLVLLGDQLIRNARLAIFELVKNAYDADADNCRIRLEEPDNPDSGRVIIEDDGDGMTAARIRNVWLEPGTDFRAKQVRQHKRTKKGRLPMGEKGVGRFAVHKLGHEIELITRARNQKEVSVKIDWRKFDQSGYLKDIPVHIEERDPRVFTGDKSGTRVVVSQLREPLTRGAVRKLYRSAMSICSPIDGPRSFATSFDLPGYEEWLTGLQTVEQIMDKAIYFVRGRIHGDRVRYEYHFDPKNVKLDRPISPRKKPIDMELLRPKRRKDDDDPKSAPQEIRFDLSDYDIGPIDFEFRIFDLDTKVLSLMDADRQGLKRYLRENGGVRVYRDGVRVFDFGEPGNDWLDLGGRRVNKPTTSIGNNQIIGIVNLDGEQSRGLVEKTNREGFIENDAYREFQDAILHAITQVEADRKEDKERLRRAIGDADQPTLEDRFAQLREELRKIPGTKPAIKILGRIENDYEDISRTLLTAAGSGLTLSSVIHEVEKHIAALEKAIMSESEIGQVERLVKELAAIIEGVSFLYRSEKPKKVKVSNLIEAALFTTQYRLDAHNIRLIRDYSLSEYDPEVKVVRRLITGALLNFIDNSIYWLHVRWGKVKHPEKAIAIAISETSDDRVRILVADSGYGIRDTKTSLTTPFFSRKPEGTGLGLHIAAESARYHGGDLVVLKSGDYPGSEPLDGAVIGIELPVNTKES